MSIGIKGMSSSGSVQRRCDILVKDSYCFFGLYNVDSSELVDIINFKSWTHSSYRKNYNVRYVNVIRSLKNKNYVVRTSIGFGPLLLRYLRSKGFIVDSSVFNSSSIFLPKFRLTLYDFQCKMVNDWLNAGGIGVIKSPTGSGKTIIGCKIIEEIKKKTLILVHTSDLLTNVWIESLINCFGLSITNKIGIVGGKLSNSDRADMNLSVRDGFVNNIEKDIVIATFQTLNNKLDEVSKYKFGLVIVDESHHAPAEMFRKVNSVVSAPYKCGLSATMKRLDGLEKDCFGQLGDIQSSVPIRELINKGILTEPRFQSPVIVDKEVCESVEKCGYRGLEFSRFVKKKSASSKMKKDFIVNVCRNVDARGRKFLLFTDYVAASDVYIRDMYSDTLSKMGVPVSIIDQGMTSEERNSVFSSLESGEISGIVLGKLGSEGVNIPSVNVVVMANALKSPITFTQRVGRAMRSAPGKVFCDVYEVLMDLDIELKWSYFNFQEYRDEGFQKLMYKVE